MPGPLLQTKLYLPSEREALVVRQRLYEQLDKGMGCKLTVISAPAGFGKTTLAADWIRQRNIKSGWISLDENDNDISRFMAYLVAAFKDIVPNIDNDIIDGFNVSHQLSAEYLLPPLINAVAAKDEPCVLVFDDYHLITSKKVHGMLAFLLDNLPPCMQMVLLTRADPPLPLARLRGRGHLNEIRAADLRFSQEEVEKFLKLIMNLSISTEDVKSLLEHTEGWIAGLQMAAVSMQGKSDVSAFIRNFTGSNRYILDFLLEEVFERQTEKVKEFLLYTSVLDQLCGPLCDAVTNDDGSQDILLQIENENLFIIPLDEDRCWYRYHRLFKDLLHQRLAATQPEIISQMHRRASAWYEEQQQIQFAIEHSLKACDFDRALEMLDSIAESVLMRSQIVTFINWLTEIPVEKLNAYPRVGLYYAWALMIGGYPTREAQTLLQALDKKDPYVRTGIELIQGSAGIYSGDLTRSIDIARRALIQLPAEDTFLRSIAGWVLGIAYLMAGDTEAADGAFEDVFRVGEKTGNTLLTVMALCHMAELRRAEGRFYVAQNLYMQARDLAKDVRGDPLPVAGMVLIGLGELYREWDDLDEASRLVLEGLALVEKWGKFAALDGYVSLARIRQAQGDAAAARSALREGQQIAIDFDATDFDDRLIESYKARIALAQGDLDTALRWMETHPIDMEVFSTDGQDLDVITDTFMHYHEVLTLVRIKIHQHQSSNALSMLMPILEKVEAQKYTGAVIKVLVLIALAYRSKGDEVRALNALERALLLAEDQKLVRSFLDEGQPLVDLLKKAASRQVAGPYARILLKIIQDTQHTDQKKIDDALTYLVEPLSEKEHQILSLLATELSVPDISAELVVAPSTVRSHIKSIYRKLDTHSRFETISRARRMGLLPKDQ